MSETVLSGWDVSLRKMSDVAEGDRITVNLTTDSSRGFRDTEIEESGTVDSAGDYEIRFSNEDTEYRLKKSGMSAHFAWKKDSASWFGFGRPDRVIIR